MTNLRQTCDARCPSDEWDERSFLCGERRLNVLVGPRNGPPLVLLHGVTRSWQDWRPVLPALMARWQVFALDHRGHGGSECEAGAYLIAGFCGAAGGFVRSRV